MDIIFEPKISDNSHPDNEQWAPYLSTCAIKGAYSVHQTHQKHSQIYDVSTMVNVIAIIIWRHVNTILIIVQVTTGASESDSSEG